MTQHISWPLSNSTTTSLLSMCILSNCNNILIKACGLCTVCQSICVTSVCVLSKKELSAENFSFWQETEIFLQVYVIKELTWRTATRPSGSYIWATWQLELQFSFVLGIIRCLKSTKFGYNHHLNPAEAIFFVCCFHTSWLSWVMHPGQMHCSCSL